MPVNGVRSRYNSLAVVDNIQFLICSSFEICIFGGLYLLYITQVYTFQEFMGFRTLSGPRDDNILETRVVLRR